MAGEKEDKDAGKETSEALKSLIARIGEIFGVFDLSFFVAGAVCFGALAFGAYVYYGPKEFDVINFKEWSGLQIGAVVLSCYVLGLVCFALGRRVRWYRFSMNDFYLDLPRQITAFGLDEHYGKPFRGDLSDAEKVKKAKLLYTKLWAEARQSKQLAPSFTLLVRYWVMAAMCDGLTVAFGVWLIVWIYWVLWAKAPCLPAPGSYFVRGAGGLILASAAWFCLGEAKRYGDYQMSELLATLAQARAAGDASLRDRRSDAKLSQDMPIELASPFDRKWPHA